MTRLQRLAQALTIASVGLQRAADICRDIDREVATVLGMVADYRRDVRGLSR